MSKKTKLPFSMMPASWGLKGKSRAIAEAEYYYEGDELEKVLAALDADTPEDKSLAELEVDYKNGKIGISEYEKQVELDWNDNFVKFLHDNGYEGKDDEAIVNKWFNDVCRTVLVQEMADQDYGMQQEGEVDVIATNFGSDSEE